ncbi:hypothetical protein IJG14_08325 [bacterium]|nr:hypothetical protein [bacterium]
MVNPNNETAATVVPQAIRNAENIAVRAYTNAKNAGLSDEEAAKAAENAVYKSYGIEPPKTNETEKIIKEEVQPTEEHMKEWSSMALQSAGEAIAEALDKASGISKNVLKASYETSAKQAYIRAKISGKSDEEAAKAAIQAVYDAAGINPNDKTEEV